MDDNATTAPHDQSSPTPAPLSSESVPPAKRSYVLGEIVFIRDEIKFQHGLIGTRISWFVGAQAFLVTPFAISLSSPLLFSHSWPLAFIGIPFLGISLSLLIVEGITQAKKRIEQQQVLLLAYDTSHLLEPRDESGHKKALRFASYVPWLFCGFWVAVILCGCAWCLWRVHHY